MPSPPVTHADDGSGAAAGLSWRSRCWTSAHRPDKGTWAAMAANLSQRGAAVNRERKRAGAAHDAPVRLAAIRDVMRRPTPPTWSGRRRCCCCSRCWWWCCSRWPRAANRTLARHRCRSGVVAGGAAGACSRWTVCSVGDAEDGSLEQWLLAPVPLAVAGGSARVPVHWLTTAAAPWSRCRS